MHEVRSFPGRDYLRQFEVTDNSRVVRRFLSERKFCDLFDTSELYFSPASKCGDEKEGRNTTMSHHLADKQLQSWGLDSKAREIAEKSKRNVETWNQSAVLINCWTMEDASCRRMWNEYGKSSKSVAVETTIGALRSALTDDFLMLSVRYVGESYTDIGKVHSLEPFFFKRCNFSWEKEVRIIAQPERGAAVETARRYRIELASVIQRVFVHPDATDTFATKVRDILARIGVTPAATPSRLI